MSEKMTASALAVFAAGVAVGAALALLYTPQAAHEARAKLGKQMGNLKSAAGHAIDEGKHVAHEAYDKGKEAARELGRAAVKSV